MTTQWKEHRHVPTSLWSGTLLALLTMILSLPAAAEPDHTTYVVRCTVSTPEARRAIEAAGGVIDHFDGQTLRAYVRKGDWATFQTTGIPYTIESIQPNPRKQLSSYPSHTEIGAFLSDVAEANPTLCQLISLGRSVQGRELWALQITDNPGVEEDEPEFAYLSTMHGDEVVGTVLCLNFIELLLEGYGQDSTITELIDETELWIVPLLNPDGYEMGIRWNANNADLNRSFPQWPTDFSGTIATESTLDTIGREPEVAAVMDWTANHTFALMANYHTGALVVNYPYDEEPGIPSGTEAPAPDDPLLRSLSSAYANLNPPMAASLSFPGGITNGSAWFSIAGGMQDWHYRFSGTIDLTLEVSNTKTPRESTLLALWNDNREAMLAYLALVHQGIRGRVSGPASGEALFATLTVDDNPQPVFTDPDIGDYHRLLTPGTYTLRAEAPGYIPYTMVDIVVPDGGTVRADITLSQGDVDGNGRVDATDLQLIVNAILGRSDNPAADVDGNGVSATDLQQLVNRVLGRA
ncbi:MAG: carboxypeptidase regulatory-like domain-containing protein [Candidatus Hydrogenedentes bacterium]|nr:carboxypeptidase regulatory-like domain-containing protein [Candidatus Hydrogenedentota bacterium]